MQGKRVDDSRSYLEFLPPSGEAPWQAGYGQGSFLAGKAGDPKSPPPVPRPPRQVPMHCPSELPWTANRWWETPSSRSRTASAAWMWPWRKTRSRCATTRLQAKPALNTWSYPDGAVRGKPVEFGAYSNYLAWITKAEIRIFAGNRSEGKPIAVLPARWDGMTIWIPPDDAPTEMVFLLRVYDREGSIRRNRHQTASPSGQEPARTKICRNPNRERLVGWGQDSRRMANIPVFGGTVTVNGIHMRAGQRVESLGWWCRWIRKENSRYARSSPPAPIR